MHLRAGARGWHGRRYHEDAQGVIISISNVKLPQEHRVATILDDQPHLHIHASVTAVVFTPAPGMTLKGTIIKVRTQALVILPM
jgi:hypothetical protein